MFFWFVGSNIASARHRKTGDCKIFNACSSESENQITAFVFSNFLMKKRGYKNGNGEIGEKARFTVSA
ncbi:hypothetical protein A1704_12245 [Chryseobacterium cucumeris]|nr:hypothetical protein A1704_12245 [Chryseobacterium cucumeris]